MTIDIVTIFPAMIEAALSAGVVGRAIERRCSTSRFTTCVISRPTGTAATDDVPFGGGPGMVMKAEPIFRALDAIEAKRGRR